MTAFTESIVEQAALAWLEGAGWSVRNGADIAPGEPGAERSDYGQVVLEQRLHDALARLNPSLPTEALNDAFRKLTRAEGPELIARNRAIHRLLVDGVTVEYRDASGAIRGAQARLLDYDEPDVNDWLAVLTTPLINLMTDALLADNILAMDETRVQVLKEPGRAAESQSIMWVMRGGSRDRAGCEDCVARRPHPRSRPHRAVP